MDHSCVTVQTVKGLEQMPQHSFDEILWKLVRWHELSHSFYAVAKGLMNQATVLPIDARDFKGVM